MDNNPYLNHVMQTNGCRIWENPHTNVRYSIPESKIEIFIKNIPKDQFEIDILPHFERFGPIYQFRLLIDYDNCNRGFAYLIYFWEKSALECLDVMGYFLIKQKPGIMLDVERSQERSHLLALNVPSVLGDKEIENGFRKLYSQLLGIFVRRGDYESDDSGNSSSPRGSCAAVLAFPDHKAALNAKRWSGVGSINLWNRNIKVLWASSEQIENLIAPTNEVKHVLAHNVPEDFDPDEFGAMMCDFLCPQEIISIRPMRSDWLIEFASTEAACSIFTTFNGKCIGDRVIFTEWVDYERLKTIDNFADFDFELRCLCIANYWDPPIFIYGRIIQFTKTQLCAVIIKNNRKNQFTTFFIEIMYENLIEIHARVCEALVIIITELKDLPNKNLVVKCSDHHAFIAGAISHLDEPVMVPSSLSIRESLYMYLDEVYALSKMCSQLIASQLLDEIYVEYKMILKQKNIQHQFICGIESGDNLLACIDPIYRHGKPLKYQMDSRNMILALCDRESFSNIGFKYFPILHDIKFQGGKSGLRLKLQKFELIPLANVQRQDVHYTFRPFIEFNHVDTYGPLRSHLTTLMLSRVNRARETEQEMTNFAPQFNFKQRIMPTKNDGIYNFDEFLDSLEM